MSSKGRLLVTAPAFTSQLQRKGWRLVPVGGAPDVEGFQQRLVAMLRAARGDSVALVEYAPIALRREHERMLQRVAMGLGVRLLSDPSGNTDPLSSFGWMAELPEETELRLADLSLVTWGEFNRGPGIGWWHAGAKYSPKVLLVGDRPGPGWGARVNWPFVSALRTGCSAWLALQLEAARVPERELYWVNAYTQDGTETDGGFVADLGPDLIVALGKHAAGWCDAYGFAFEEVHHPQFWKRFHAQHTYRLTQLLKRRKS